ncbi:GTP-sensing pleiotropic transcriptional regulator CodY [Clostridium luticellarii]|jgi:transcriptional pleiotropic repressor|uniref:Global transcriptional regulator CodY n=1 Tax=Clostridium luticellarii TaxID=1691940 RepID=A0A2T0BR87_9CLOT|nr:GTP-sensing pleiotropic transcriptional regulator CodY [Clostridium luticellarii]MCI1943900.1 GTP-sensing pleiotropic transcriptional regulator CodY [Clostridium luticellarii]MCI1967161.1 GTP-sensing pleiotropic transcriptional regulator CodY [Clostridium luticellarii]MCI1994528.1 GTP-sensing pleiotropic transcriptional regulator CodY [Clostridium luticellarii]MCI2038519.1 GTP-sensing pleiotropic transcriptional regulator CodY [Clostridium luticellarii]PRR86394.1 GTP-sensing transcriptional
MTTLLDKTRKLNKILQKSGTEPVVFDDICKLLSEVLGCNIYIISRRGKILGYNFPDGFECDIVKDKIISEMKFPEHYNNKLLNARETIPNLANHGICVFEDGSPCNVDNKLTTIVPIVGNRERLGTLLLASFGERFVDEDLILAEYSATIIGLEILRAKNDEIEEEARKKAVVQLAIGTLSYSELEAVEHIFNELDGNEGLLVASKIADKVGITRSVIVNALRKFESAGVIESRSLGMKGTHIKILNEKLLDELKKIK